MEGYEMKFFTGRTKVLDERIVNMQNKIYREIYMGIMALCMLSIGWKFYLNGSDPGNVITELVIMVGQGIYYIIRSTSMGLLSSEVEMHNKNSRLSFTKKNIILPAMVGLGLAAFFATNSAINYADTREESIYYFVLVFFVTLLFYIPFFLIIFGGPFLAAKKISDKIESKELEDDENI